MKKIMFFSLMVIYMISSGVLAEETTNITVIIDGEEIQPDDQARMIEGRTLLPARSVFEGLGADMEWDPETQTASGVIDGFRVDIPLGSTKAIISGETEELEVPAKAGRTYVPLQFAAQAFGGSVHWDGKTSTVTITMTNSAPQPTLVLTYDDGYLEDYTDIFPVHKKYDVPGVSAVGTGAMGTVYDRVIGKELEFMTLEQMLEMQKFGWEFICHTRHHMNLSGKILNQPTSFGDTKIYIDQPYQNFYRQDKDSNVEMVIKENEKEEIIIAKGFDKENEEYIEVKNGIEKSYTKEAVVRLSPETHKDETYGNMEDLKSMGLNVKNHGYPYGDNDSYARKASTKYYNSARGTGVDADDPLQKNVHFSDYYTLEDNNYFRTYDISAPSLDYKDHDWIDEKLDKVEEVKGLLIFYAHPNKDVDLADRVEYIIQECQDRGIEITTMQKALEKFGD
ncbi:stalk domain-containing protein [Natranaerobius trueperi]|uniref:NodB homology domain-containing protein n=1 Tax=Natranaerobius trueperi TaxID=759412 RepID=A0A226BW63_9FIRM|nr:stalk domain-containing protein [Natranaerobius trueperi]OWZ83233.1 hypothetical protein CDO51_09640 [Natranaerobius trueperi]